MAGYFLKSRQHNFECGSSSSNKLQIVGDVDRFNILPPEIQRKIFSLLPTLDATKSGLLSKTLRTTWYSLPKLIFDYFEFPEMESKRDSFMRFIDQTLARHDESDVKIFKLMLWPLTECSILVKTEWIEFAIQHKVRNLVIYGWMPEAQDLPSCLFSCHYLVKLEVAIEKLVLTWPQNLDLPNLRRLRLKFLVLSGWACKSDMFSCFPALEKLSIFFCDVSNFKVLFISCSKLREFKICNCPGLEGCSVDFQTPPLSKIIYIHNAQRNDESDIELNFPQHETGLVIDVESLYLYRRKVCDLDIMAIKLTRELFKANRLVFSHWLIEFLCIDHHLPEQMAFDVFPNLMTLDISIWALINHVKTAILLISRSPYLSELTFSIKNPPENREDFYFTDMVDYEIKGGFCKLRNITVKFFGGTNMELMLVKLLLRKAHRLRLMRIEMDMDMVRNDMELKIIKILGYEKASQTADVIFG